MESVEPLMRSVAALLLMFCSAASVRASIDRVQPAHAGQSSPLRLLLLTISEPDHSTPTSPPRREPSIEAAIDEEETYDLDPLDAPPHAVATDLSASTHPEASPFLVPSPSPPNPRRPGSLRC